MALAAAEKSARRSQEVVVRCHVTGHSGARQRREPGIHIHAL
jgi:hypothetical protein